MKQALFVILLFAVQKIQAQHSNDVKSFAVRVEFDHEETVDSLFLLWDKKPGIPGNSIAFEKVNTGEFSFKGEVPGLVGKFTIKAKPGDGSSWNSTQKFVPLTPAFYCMSGDQIVLSIKKATKAKIIGDPLFDFSFTFSGPNYLNNTAWLRILKQFRLPAACPDPNQSDYRIFCNENLKSAIAQLEIEKDSLSDNLYTFFKAELIGRQRNRVRSAIAKFYSTNSDTTRLVTLSGLKKAFSFEDSLCLSLTEQIAIESTMLVDYLLEREILKMLPKSARDKTELVSQIVRIYRGKLQDKLLVALFFKNSLDSPEAADYRTIYNLLSDTGSKQLLSSASSYLAGQPVKDFVLPDISGKLRRISDLKGKIVFIDLWFSGCGACLSYYQRVLKTVHKNFESNHEVLFVSISSDRKIETWKKSVLSEKYTNSSAINLYTNGVGTDHEWMRFYNFSELPKFMILDKNGDIFGIYRNPQNTEIGSIEKLTTTLNKASLKE